MLTRFVLEMHVFEYACVNAEFWKSFLNNVKSVSSRDLITLIMIGDI